MGTRFRIYVQSPLAGPPFDQPELVTLGLPPSEIKPGPEDERIYVLDAIKGKYPNTPGAHVYDSFGGRSWGGAFHPPVQPSPEGHFDHLVPGTRPFAAASVYASVRLVLAIWERYFAEMGCKAIQWHHQPQPKHGVDARLELNPWSLDNGARAGYGFVEIGTGLQGEQFNHRGPLWSNFDVIAHEFGHTIIFGRIGFPKNMTAQTEWYSTDNKRQNRDFLAFHESAADLIAIVSSLHHDKVVDHVLEHSRGNLRAQNLVNSIGELGNRSAIRYANNDYKVSKFAGADPAQLDIHGLSQVLTGAIYSVLVDVYERSRKGPSDRQALLHARDWLGCVLAKAWSALAADGMTFRSLRNALIEADGALKEGMADRFASHFRDREIS